MDIETAPTLGYVWGKWQVDVIDVERAWYILSYAAKTPEGVVVKGLIDYPHYKKDRENDEALVKDLWKLLNEADICVAHNGDKFDFPKINARMLVHGLPPPKPYQTVDTRKLAKKHFRFDSNKLDDIGHQLGLGRKIPTNFSLWLGCMRGDPDSWQSMKKYNRQDILLLEKVYHKLLAWASNHPNVNFGDQACPKCGSHNLSKQGFKYTMLRKKQQYQCKSCHGWFLGAAVKE